MKNPRLGLIRFISFSLVLTWAVSAWALRCHGRIVSEGDTKYDVLSKCGEPSFVDVREEAYMSNSISDAFSMRELVGVTEVGSTFTEKITFEEWTYDFGPHRFIYYLRFENGVLKNIRTGDYGRP